jgi:hypothetical protein
VKTDFIKAKKDLSWRQARAAGGLLLRYEKGNITPLKKRILKSLLLSPGVTHRLIDQGIAYHVGRTSSLRLVEARS